jgi:hypothetical protein
MILEVDSLAFALACFEGMQVQPIYMYDVLLTADSSRLHLLPRPRGRL